MAKSAKDKGHPLDSLTFNPPKLDEIPAKTEEAPALPASEQPAKSKRPKEPIRSSNVTLPVKVWEWIDAKHAESRSNGGSALRKAAIIRAVFEAVMSLDVNLSGAKSEKELIDKITQAIKQ